MLDAVVSGHPSPNEPACSLRANLMGPWRLLGGWWLVADG